MSTTAVADVDLTIGKGEFVSFIGPSGCGKTTFLRVIADLEKPTEGAIRINGMTPEEARRNRAYGYVFSRPWHYLWFTIVALAYGSALVLFVSFVANLATFLAARTVATGMGADAVQALIAGNPQSLGGNAIIGIKPAIAQNFWGTTPAGVWSQIAALLVSGFVASYFWSASTIIYFLLRQSDDATDLKDVYLPEEEDEDDDDFLDDEDDLDLGEDDEEFVDDDEDDEDFDDEDEEEDDEAE